MPRWAGWVYALTTFVFALGLFFPPVVQNVTSALLLAATLAVAWSASREGARQSGQVEMAPGT